MLLLVRSVFVIQKGENWLSNLLELSVGRVNGKINLARNRGRKELTSKA